MLPHQCTSHTHSYFLFIFLPKKEGIVENQGYRCRGSGQGHARDLVGRGEVGCARSRKVETMGGVWGWFLGQGVVRSWSHIHHLTIIQGSSNKSMMRRQQTVF